MEDRVFNVDSLIDNLGTIKKSSCPFISVIVPVYKVEKYLPQCIESILKQTFADFELLLIDDGSPDRSGVICDEYAVKDSRIIVFHKENGGVSSARNLGLENVRGSWITFVDSDDYLELTAFETFVSKIANNEDFDAISYSFNFIDQFGNYKGSQRYKSNTYSKNEIFRSAYNESIPTLLWLFFIKKQYAKNIRFNEYLFHGEDTIWLLKCFSECSKIHTCCDSFYNYRLAEQSLTRGSCLDNKINQVKLLRKALLEIYSSDLDESSKELYIDQKLLNVFLDSLRYSAAYNVSNHIYSQLYDVSLNYSTRDLCQIQSKKIKILLYFRRKSPGWLFVFILTMGFRIKSIFK